MRRLSGRGLEELARERIFDPLGMHDSYYVVPESESHRVVQRASGLPFADSESPFMAGPRLAPDGRRRRTPERASSRRRST